MKTNLRNLCWAIGAAVVLSACGGSSESPDAEAQEVASVPDEQPGEACKLLNREQVDTVIPGNDGGREKDTSEASLLQDVEMEHCQYTYAEGMNIKFLDVIIYEAGSDEAFEQIALGEWANEDSFRRLDIGDGGFLFDHSTQGEMVATASKGLTVFEVKLYAEDAAAKSEQLVDLARIVDGKL
jgi:hypothetical protein